MRKKLQILTKKFIILSFLCGGSILHASPLIAAFQIKTFNAEFYNMPKQEVAILPSDISQERRKLPVAFAIPLNARVTQRLERSSQDMDLPALECYIPERSLLIVRLVENNNILSWVHWPSNFSRANLKLCSKNVQAQSNGLCADGKPPEVFPCANGSYLAIDIKEIRDQNNNLLSTERYIHHLNTALQR